MIKENKYRLVACSDVWPGEDGPPFRRNPSVCLRNRTTSQRDKQGTDIGTPPEGIPTLT
jgi:hypothetical protein